MTVENLSESAAEVVAATWICLREGKVLVVRPGGQSAFYLPGGTPEAGETWARTAAREVEEEVGISMLPIGCDRSPRSWLRRTDDPG